MTDFERRVLGSLGIVIRALAFLLRPTTKRKEQLQLADHMLAWSGMLMQEAETGEIIQDDEEIPDEA